MENFIKESKAVLSFIQMKIHAYVVKEACMKLSLLAYSLTNWLCTLSFLHTAKGIQIQTIRKRPIKVANKISEIWTLPSQQIIIQFRLHALLLAGSDQRIPIKGEGCLKMPYNHRFSAQ